ncbi:MAG: alpha/beta fold hydrolase [Pirellulales bacterium]|nr:alpha/beta fold hydrolase [Pirellulales bacterium]
MRRLPRVGYLVLVLGLWQGVEWTMPRAALAQGARPKKSASEIEIPAPENVALVTDDRLTLQATYYPGVDAASRGKDIVPVILLHGFKGNRNEWADLATMLQTQRSADDKPIGHAVIVPDLRGHGESIYIEGRPRPLEVDRLRPEDFKNMVRFDLEAVKKFLMAKNNAGELNIEKLCVVGADMGAVVGANWAAADWSWPVLAGQKQGRDVKALAMISPPRDFKGLNTYQAIEHPALQREISILVAVGQGNQRSLTDARSIYARLEKTHPAPPPAEAATLKTLFFDPHDTSLQGTKMLGENLNLEVNLQQFITLRLVNQPFPWRDRSSVLTK